MSVGPEAGERVAGRGHAPCRRRDRVAVGPPLPDPCVAVGYGPQAAARDGPGAQDRNARGILELVWEGARSACARYARTGAGLPASGRETPPLCGAYVGPFALRAEAGLGDRLGAYVGV